MPFVAKPSCSSCKTKRSNLWRKDQSGQVYCTLCAKKELDGCTDDTNSAEGSVSGASVVKSSDWTPPASQSASAKFQTSHLLGPLRKSARIKPSKYKYQPFIKGQLAKGRNRRSIFKKNPIKAPSAVSTVVTSQYVFFEGQYWQTGDVVSVMDDDGGVYYAQIRGFLQDQYCEKSAVITWLLPTASSPTDRFDPATYIIGPEEDIPRSLSCFELEMHAPSSYFQDKSAPYRTQPEGPELGFIWTRLGPEIRRVPPPAEVFGLRELDSDASSNTVEKVRTKHEVRKNKREVNARKKGRGLKGAAAKGKDSKDKIVNKDKMVVASKDKPATKQDVVKDKVNLKDKSTSLTKYMPTASKAEVTKESTKDDTTSNAPIRTRRERGRPRKMSIN